MKDDKIAVEEGNTVDDTRPAPPLGQLGNFLRPLSGRGPNFRKEGVEGKKRKKKKVLDASKKNSAHPLTRKQNFYYIMLNIGSTNFFLV